MSNLDDADRKYVFFARRAVNSRNKEAEPEEEDDDDRVSLKDRFKDRDGLRKARVKKARVREREIARRNLSKQEEAEEPQEEGEESLEDLKAKYITTPIVTETSAKTTSAKESATISNRSNEGKEDNRIQISKPEPIGKIIIRRASNNVVSKFKIPKEGIAFDTTNINIVNTAGTIKRIEAYGKNILATTSSVKIGRVADESSNFARLYVNFMNTKIIPSYASAKEDFKKFDFVKAYKTYMGDADTQSLSGFKDVYKLKKGDGEDSNQDQSGAEEADNGAMSLKLLKSMREKQLASRLSFNKDANNENPDSENSDSENPNNDSNQKFDPQAVRYDSRMNFIKSKNFEGEATNQLTNLRAHQFNEETETAASLEAKNAARAKSASKQSFDILEKLRPDTEKQSFDYFKKDDVDDDKEDVAVDSPASDTNKDSVVKANKEPEVDLDEILNSLAPKKDVEPNNSPKDMKQENDARQGNNMASPQQPNDPRLNPNEVRNPANPNQARQGNNMNSPQQPNEARLNPNEVRNPVNPNQARQGNNMDSPQQPNAPRLNPNEVRNPVNPNQARQGNNTTSPQQPNDPRLNPNEVRNPANLNQARPGNNMNSPQQPNASTRYDSLSNIFQSDDFDASKIGFDDDTITNTNQQQDINSNYSSSFYNKN